MYTQRVERLAQVEVDRVRVTLKARRAEDIKLQAAMSDSLRQSFHLNVHFWITQHSIRSQISDSPMGTRFWEEAFGELAMPVDGVIRRTPSWADWAITTRLNTSDYWEQVWQAVSCHRSQLPGYQALQRLPAEYHQALWGTQTFYRVYSLVDGGRAIERDLFEGLR